MPNFIKYCKRKYELIIYLLIHLEIYVNYVIIQIIALAIIYNILLEEFSMRRKRLITIWLIVFTLFTFTSCASKATVVSKHSKDTVTLYASEWCSVNITVKVQDGENLDSFSRKVELEYGTTTLTLNDFALDYLSENAIIVEVITGEPKTFWLIDTFLKCGVIVGLTVIFSLIYCIKNKEKLSAESDDATN